MFDWLLRVLGFRSHHWASTPIATAATNELLCAELADEKSRIRHLDRRLQAQTSMLDETNARNKHLQAELEIKMSRLRNLEQRHDAQTSKMTEVKHRNEYLEAESKRQRCCMPNLEEQWEQEASRLAEVKGENGALWSQFTKVRAEVEEAKRWEREARGKLNIQGAEIQVPKKTNNDLEVKLERKNCYIRQLEGECHQVSNILCEVMNEKDVFENRPHQLQKELDSEKQRAERLQSEEGEREKLATALEAERATVRNLKLCADAQKNELDQLKADRESESVPKLQQLIKEN
jgi:chromosome segregation ATPase